MNADEASAEPTYDAPRCETESGGILGEPRTRCNEQATHVHLDTHFGDHRHCASHACPGCHLIADVPPAALTAQPTFA